MDDAVAMVGIYERSTTIIIIGLLLLHVPVPARVDHYQ